MITGIVIPPRLDAFLAESLALEGIPRGALLAERDATAVFLSLVEVKIDDLTVLARAFNPRAELRDKRESLLRLDPAMPPPPPSGKPVVTALKKLLPHLQDGDEPWAMHGHFMRLAPYTQGNGLVGRAVLLRQWLRGGNTVPTSFLVLAYRLAIIP